MPKKDNIDKAVEKAMEGKMNPELFKQLMPMAAAKCRDSNGCGDDSDLDLSYRIFDSARSKMMKFPHLMEQKMLFQPPGGVPETLLDLHSILPRCCIQIGMDGEQGLVDAPYYVSGFGKAFEKNVKHKMDDFSLHDDDDVIRDIFFPAYVMTIYQFQEEIEAYQSKKLEQVCPLVHDKEGFVQQLTEELQLRVALPSEVSTVQELLREATQNFRAWAVYKSFLKPIHVIKSAPEYYECLQCWVCKADDTDNCSVCNVAAFCGRKCQRVAWKKNHKVLCPHYKRIMEHAMAQCQRIAKVRKGNFIPGCLIQPNGSLDYKAIATKSIMDSRRIGEPLGGGSIDNLYKNIVKVEKNKKAFRTLFKRGDKVERGSDRILVKSLTNVCVALMYNGNPPPSLPPAPKVTRSTFLSAYKNDLDGGCFLQSSDDEELVKGTVTVALKRLFIDKDYHQYPKEAVEALQCQVANPCTNDGNK